MLNITGDMLFSCIGEANSAVIEGGNVIQLNGVLFLQDVEKDKFLLVEGSAACLSYQLNLNFPVKVHMEEGTSTQREQLTPHVFLCNRTLNHLGYIAPLRANVPTYPPPIPIMPMGPSMPTVPMMAPSQLMITVPNYLPNTTVMHYLPQQTTNPPFISTQPDDHIENSLEDDTMQLLLQLNSPRLPPTKVESPN